MRGCPLFAIPTNWRRRTFPLDWERTRELPWELLILFGGGLEFLTTSPVLLLLAGVTVFVILLTELTSNTATAAAFLPVAGALAVGADLAPLFLAAPVVLAASLAFMLPVPTPPTPSSSDRGMSPCHR